MTQPDGPWPTEPQRLGDSLGALGDRIATIREKARRAAARNPARFAPIEEENDGLTPAGRQQLAWESIVPKQLAVWRWDNLTHHVAEVGPKLARWLDVGAGPLLLVGDPGVGKTVAACATAYAWWEGGRREVVFARAQEVLHGFKRDEPEHRALRRRLEAATSRTLVVLDDIGTSAPWPDEAAQFGTLLSRIIDHGARLIATTNLTKDERAAHLDLRWRSRLEAGGVINVKGDDLRGRPLPDAPATTPCPFGCIQPQGFMTVESWGADAIVIEAEARRWREPDPSEYPTTPDGDAALRKDLAEAERQFTLIREALVPCPHCRPASLDPSRRLHALVLRRAGRLAPEVEQERLGLDEEEP